MNKDSFIMTVPCASVNCGKPISLTKGTNRKRYENDLFVVCSEKCGERDLLYVTLPELLIRINPSVNSEFMS